MPKHRKNSALYKYLEPFLASGDESAIQQGRKAYIKRYKVVWRQQQRQRTKQYTVAFTPNEAAEMGKQAAAHRMSVTGFIKAVALKYRSEAYIVPDADQVGIIRELLLGNYVQLQELAEAHSLPYNFESEQLARMGNLEARILAALEIPDKLIAAVRKAIHANESFKNELLHLLNECGNDTKIHIG